MTDSAGPPEQQQLPIPGLPAGGAAAGEAPSGRPAHRWGSGSAIAVWLILGIAIGFLPTFVGFRVLNAPGTAEVRVDEGAAPSAPGDVTAVAKSLGPSVGTLVADVGGGRFAEGSGFVISHDQHVSFLVTNNHVVAGSSSVHVLMPNGRLFTATIVGADAVFDLAVVSVPDTTLPVATFGDSDQLQVGETVVAIGSPLGNVGSVTSGVLSALHRTIQASGEGTATENLEDVLQTDAPINPGNSGGPLADLEGRVIGVNVATQSNSSGNIGFSIPSNLARHVAELLIAHKGVGHPFLGISYYTAVEAVEAGHGFDGAGVLVRGVQPGSPADRAGFRAGDILVSIDGVTIESGETLGGLLVPHQVGDVLHCSVKRGDSTLTLTVTLGERPAGAGAAGPTPTP